VALAPEDSDVSMRCIFVPIDFSEHSARALEVAVGLARRFGARIELAHAYGAPMATLRPYGSAFPIDLIDGVRNTARTRLDAEATRLREAGIEVSSHLTKRTPQQALAWLAGEVDADLVVMGTRGLSGLKQVLLGSVAHHMIREAPCPVMTVPEPVPSAGPLRFRSILLATDFSTAQAAAVELAQELAGSDGEGAEIAVVHVIYIPPEIRSEVEQSGEAMLRVLRDPARVEVEAIVDELHQRGCRARGAVLIGRPEEALLREANESAVDLIVMGTHGRSGLSHLILGSVAERVVRGARCPVVTVKPA